MKLVIENETDCVKETRRIKRVLKSALKKTLGTDNFEIGVVLTGEERIIELNKRYMQEEGVTDVLSFPLYEADELKGEIKSGSIRCEALGDIVICIPEALRRAEKNGISMAIELENLAVHGLLHLVGYDDSSEDEAEKMAFKEKSILGRSALELERQEMF